MKQYIYPFLSYVVFYPLLKVLFQSDTIGYFGRVIISMVLVLYFWKDFKLEYKFYFSSIFVGLGSFLIWVLIDGLYPHLGSQEFVPSGVLSLVLKLLGLLIAAPLIEELFIRDFFNRLLVNMDWKKVPIGKFTPFSFIFTVLFFGFSHSRWLAGILVGVTFNLYLMKTKKIESAIQAHFFANLFLATFVIYNQLWYFW